MNFLNNLIGDTVHRFDLVPSTYWRPLSFLQVTKQCLFCTPRPLFPVILTIKRQQAKRSSNWLKTFFFFFLVWKLRIVNQKHRAKLQKKKKGGCKKQQKRSMHGVPGPTRKWSSASLPAPWSSSSPPPSGRSGQRTSFAPDQQWSRYERHPHTQEWSLTWKALSSPPPSLLPLWWPPPCWSPPAPSGYSSPACGIIESVFLTSG